MFRIVCDPSSGSTELCLTEITLNGSQIFFVCLVGVLQGNFEPAVCVHGMTGWELLFPARSTVHTHTHTHTYTHTYTHTHTHTHRRFKIRWR